MIKKLLIVLTATLLLLALSPVEAASTSNPIIGQQQHAAELFFFQHANQGKITSNKNNNCYQLVLTDTDKKLTYFSRAPQRISGQITIPGFINTWNHNNVKPNAILHATLTPTGMKKRDVSDVILIKQAEYNHQLNTVTYQVCSLNKNKKLQTGNLSNTNIFIDPFHPWPP